MSGHAKKAHGASKQDFIIMGVTFLVGIFAGFYLYTTAFAPKFNEFVNQTEDVYSKFVLEGSQYGGDRMGGSAPSFQVLDDGSYRYLPYATSNEEPVAKEGSVPRALLSEVRQILTPEALEIAGGSVVRGDCMSYADGMDYSYKVTLDDVDYSLDTCTTALTSDSLVGTTLDKLWNYFETVE